MLTLSLIIPVYNEEHHIGACLNAIKNQTVKPDKVIVVDNNCTDRTVEIVKEYDFVTIIKQPAQGRAHARNAGFEAASGDIYGRIDADSRIEPDWVERVKARFTADTELTGITGLGLTDWLPYISIKSLMIKLPSRVYYWFVHFGFKTTTMWGANMAIRSDVWPGIRGAVIVDDADIHEDQDISLCIAALNKKIEVDNDLLIRTEGQTFRYLPKFIRYNRMFFNTRKQHITTIKNLSTYRLSALRLIPGLLAGIFIGLIMFCFVLVLFIPDYALIKLRYKHRSLN